MMMVNLATKNLEDEGTDEGSQGEHDVEHGEVAHSPVAPMEPAARKQGRDFTESDNEDEPPVCHDPDCTSSVIINNKDLLCCDSPGCYLTVRLAQISPFTLLNSFYI